MATKMKGFFKGFKYISQIFVYKEHEMEIGYPTDVRHVAHFGWDSSPVNAPSWMNEFKTTSDFSSTSLSLSSFGQPRETSWVSQDFDQTRGIHSLAAAAAFPDFTLQPLADVPKVPKKTKRKKAKPLSTSPGSSSKPSKSRGPFTATIGEGGDPPSECGGC